MRISITALGLVASLGACSAGAAPLDISQLPADLVTCAGAGQCFFTTSSVFDVNVPGKASISAYQYTDLRSGTPQSKYLVRYGLQAPSGYGGDLWVSLDTSYDAAQATHNIDLYVDRATPVPALNAISPYNQGSDMLTFGLSTQDLLAGGGYRFVQYNDFLYPDPSSTDVVQGNMLVDGSDVVYACLAAGCGGEVDLNLVDLAFSQSGNSLVAGFSAADPRAVLLKSRSFYLESAANGGYDTTQSFYVQAVPLPGAGALFLGGLLSLVTRVRRGHA